MGKGDAMSRDVTNALFVGATLRSASDGNSYLAAVKVPGSYRVGSPKYVEKKSELEQERADAFQAPASAFNDGPFHRPLTGILHSVVVLNREGSTVFSATMSPDNPQRGTVAAQLVRYLTATFPTQFAESLAHGDADTHSLIFGFDIKEILRLVGLEVLGYNAQRRDFVPVPVRLWHNPLGVYNPVDVFLSASDKKDLDLWSLVRYFNIQAEPRELARDAMRQAQVASELVAAGQLVAALREAE
jgi:hypothetical protein